MTAGTVRTLHEAEVDYVKDLATRWQSYSYVSAGVGLVLGLIAGSMRGYVVGGSLEVSGQVAYGLAIGLLATGGLICGVLQIVARRLGRDIEAARVESLQAQGRAEAAKGYVYLDAAGRRFMLTRSAWERLGLPLGPGTFQVEYTPVSRVVLTVNGLPAHG